MISLEQIRKLEEKVQAAVSRIRVLTEERDRLAAENVTLKERLESHERRVAELQTMVSAFKADQDEIEAGIIAALNQLDELEDTVSEPQSHGGEPADAALPRKDVAPATDSPDAEGGAAATGHDEAADEPASPDSEPGSADVHVKPASPNDETDDPGSVPADDPEDEEEPELDIF